MKTHFQTFAAYNAWANARLYDAAAAIPDADYQAECGAFFGSLHGTLSHILVADRIWMQRFTGEGPTYTDLGARPCADLASLRAERAAEDTRIAAFIDGLEEPAFAGKFSYRTISNPQDITQPLAPALTHFFNHQTHHRGQAHGLLTQIGGRPASPVLDLLYFQRETGIGLG